VPSEVSGRPFVLPLGERGWLLMAFGHGPNGLAYPSWERTVQADQTRPIGV